MTGPFQVSNFRPGRRASDSLPPTPCRWGGNWQLETSPPSPFAPHRPRVGGSRDCGAIATASLLPPTRGRWGAETGRAGPLLAGQSLPRRHGVGGGGRPGLQNPGDLRSALSARSGDPRRTRRRGLSLLEVILAVAILGGCLAVTGELVRLGVRHAEEARELTRAQLLCESKMEEIAAGVAATESASTVPFETDPDWTYTVDVSQLDQQQLTLVRVTVQQLESDRLYPIAFTLSRWILNSASASDETSTETTTEGTSSGASS